MIPDKLKSSLSLTISSSMKEVRKLGLAVRKFCKQTPFDELETYHVELAVVEAANNIIKHTYKEETNQELELNVYLCDDKITLALTDTGEPVENLSRPATLIFDPDFVNDLPQGRMGLYLIHKIMDVVQSSSNDGVNLITMTKFFPGKNGKERI